MANFTGTELEQSPELGDFNSSPAVNQQGTTELSDPVTPPALIPFGVSIVNQPNILAYVNRVHDAVEGGPVIWVTYGASDIAQGGAYPGPGTFDPTESGSDTSEHTIESIIDAGLISGQ